MRFKGLDLNLLAALDVLLAEKNVSAAADKLYLSQSATSGALARLREYFDDELLLQVGRRMVLTPRAIELSEHVRAALVQIDSTIIQEPVFDPGKVQREVRILASDYVAVSVLSTAVRRIAHKAPGLTIAISPPTHEPHGEIEHGKVDMLVMPERYLSRDHPSKQLFSDQYVVMADANNRRLGDQIDEEQFFSLSHVIARFPTRTPLYEDWFLQNRRRERKVGAVAGEYSLIPFLVVGTERIALMQRRMAETFAEMMPLRLLESPIDIDPLVECMQWHAHATNDKCLAWIRAEFLAAQPP